MARNKSIRIESLTATTDKNSTSSYAHKQVLKLLDSISIKIISELVRLPIVELFRICDIILILMPLTFTLKVKQDTIKGRYT